MSYDYASDPLYRDYLAALDDVDARGGLAPGDTDPYDVYLAAYDVHLRGDLGAIVRAADPVAALAARLPRGARGRRGPKGLQGPPGRDAA